MPFVKTTDTGAGMLQVFTSWLRFTRMRVIRLAGFLSPAVIGLVFLVLLPASGQSQQLPSASQLMQLQQQYGSGSQGQQASPPQNLPQPIILQPAVPQNFQNQLPPSRLEQILSQRASARLRQFGYDQLGRGSQVVIPETGAVQDDYILGPGDEIVVSLRGQENNEFRAIVDRNGRVVLPRLSPVAASGRSFGSFREDIQAAVRRAYVATDASISVGRMRQISVMVSGEVNSPGQRLVTGLSSAVDALILSGGIKKTGSLRAVRIQRNDHVYTVDLYNILTSGGAGSAMRLADGDRILVPPLGPTVAVTGLVRRPGIFELPPRQSSMSVKALLALAGGQEVRGRYRLSLLHILTDGRSDMVQLSGENGQVRDSEILFVQLGADQVTSQATLSGGTGLAGSYPVVTGTRLSEVLKAPGALGTSPYTAFGILVRKDLQTLMPSLMAFTPVAVLTGREDQVLQGDDLIRVLSSNEAQLLTFVVHTYLERLATQQTAIRNPLGQSANGQNSLARQVQVQSGQSAELEDISSVPANVQRQEIIRLLEAPAPGSDLARHRDQARRARQSSARLAQQQQPLAGQGGGAAVPGINQYSLQNGANGQPANTNELLNDAAGGDDFDDGIENYNANNNYGNGYGFGGDNSQNSNNGNNSNNGTGSNANGNGNDDNNNNNNNNNGLSGQNAAPPRNFTDQPIDNGRFASNREVQTFGQLARQLGVDPLILVNFLVDHRARLEGAVRGPGYYFVGPSATLNDMVQTAGGTVNWADESGVELISTAVDRQTGRATTQRTSLPLRQGTLASYVVKPRDQLRFGQVFSDVGIGSVTVQGEVRYAGTFPILRGEHLSDLLSRAGGLTKTAYPYGTVFLRQSAAQLERDGYNRAANEVQSQLVIAMTRVGNDKIDPNTFASMQTFVAELRNQRALGRISIVADPSVLAANPAQDPLLEAGDVIYIPPRPGTISVLGQVLQPGSYPYRAGESIEDYIGRAGGYARTADESQTFIVLPDGSARRMERSWLKFSADNLPPGSTIVVPRDVTPLDLRQSIIDVSQIFSQFAVAIASVAVLSRQ
jgi:protein involved in polysaccharide export with SLBB domain